MLADKVNGTSAGLWLLAPEHLRLGTWDLLCGWSGQPADTVGPRLALQLVHEAALCVTGVRQGRTWGQTGFELANGLPFIASDLAIHELRDAHTVQQAQELQAAQYQYKGFVTTATLDGPDPLITDFPKRWHVEEFFHDHQELGWQKAGTPNLNIRCGRMTLALLAQAALHQLRQRLGEPVVHWQASHWAKSVLAGMDGGIRVHDDTIVAAFYSAPLAKELRPHYENLPAQLEAEGIKPEIPWLYHFKLDFRFKQSPKV